jgi:hypothetical protein
MTNTTAAISLIATLLMTCAPLCAEDSSWTDEIDFSGDFRLRYEGIDEDFEVERNRMRFRGRFGLTATVSDDINFVLRLATGGDNPVSTNQSFDGGFSTKDIGVDLAYVDWKILDNLSLFAGKMKNPLFRAGGVPLIWDSDLTPEGIALKYSVGPFFGTVGGFSVEERSGSDDSLLTVVQGGIKFPIGDNNELTMGAGYFAYTNTIGNKAFHNGNAKGNTLDINDLYVFEYQNTELFAQIDTKIANRPLQLFAHFAKNSEASREDTAFAYGAKIGLSKDKGQVQFIWIYQDIEADSVIGTFNDSDYGGGGSDSKGHIFSGKYGISKKMFVGGTFYLNEVERFQGVEHDYNRIQLDLGIKFN